MPDESLQRTASPPLVGADSRPGAAWPRSTSRSPGLVPLLLGVGVALTLAYGFLFSGLGFDNDDYPEVYLRINEYVVEFRNGRFPQNFPDAIGGGGYAFPRFYPPFAYYISAVIWAVVRDVVWAGHLSALLSVVLSGAAMAWAARAMGASLPAAALAALAYAAMPYRFTVVAVRGALAESWAMVWLPFLLVGCWWLFTRPARHAWLFCAAYAALLVTHTATALWAGVLVVVASMLACSRTPRLADVLTVITATIIGVGLAAWYLIPMVWYLPTVWASDPQTMWATANDFVGWRVSWTILLGNGVFRLEPGWPMRLSLGPWGVVVPFALLLMTLEPTDTDHRKARRVSLGVGGVGLLSAVFVLVPSLIAPVLPKQFLYLQFPYRLLGLAAMLGSVSLALSLSVFRNAFVRRSVAVIWAGTVFVSVLVEFYRPRPPGVRRQQELLQTLPNSASGFTARLEYLPKGADPAQVAQRISAAREGLRSIALLTSGQSGNLEASFTLEEGGTVVLPLVAYDFLDVRNSAGDAVPWSEQEGLVAAQVGPGPVHLVVGRRLPPPYWWGAGASALALFALLLVTRGFIVIRPEEEGNSRPGPQVRGVSIPVKT